MDNNIYIIKNDFTGKKKSFAKNYIQCYKDTKREVPKLKSIALHKFILTGKGSKLLAELLKE